MTSDALDGWFHVGLATIGLLAWAIASRTDSPRLRRVGYASVLVAGAVAFPGYDRVTGGDLAHPSELFHYVFGPTYFPELGYADFYDGLVTTGSELGFAKPEAVRDLRTNRVDTLGHAHERGAVVLARFTEARRRELAHDLATFRHEFGDVQVDAVLDHGFNATPPWIAVARAILRDRPITSHLLRTLPYLDVALVALAAVLLVAVYGLPRASVAILLAGTAYTFRFAWTGGSFLRFDWVAALVVALVAAKKERFALCGAALAWATASRIFPACFAFATFASLVAAARSSGRGLALRRCAVGYVATLTLAFAVGLGSGRGLDAYREFGARFETHRATWASNHIGFDTLLVADRIVFGTERAVPGALDAFATYADPIEHARASRRPVRVLVVLVVLVLVVVAASRVPPDRALPLGATIVFSMSTISGYYWIMLVLVPLAAPRRTAAALIACTFLHAGVELVLGSLTMAHVAVSVAYAATLGDYLGLVLRNQARSRFDRVNA